MLYTSTKLSSLEIKERLNLSWTEYYNAVNALNKADLIQILEDFDENSLKRQFIVIEDKGRDEYDALISLIDQFVQLAKEFMPNQLDDKLYP
jgi:DNA-directed RNA polymerase specialized sigma subunit